VGGRGEGRTMATPKIHVQKKFTLMHLSANASYKIIELFLNIYLVLKNYSESQKPENDNRIAIAESS
jgi:hypothetical protein